MGTKDEVFCGWGWRGGVATTSRAGDETGEIIIGRTGRVVKTFYPVPALGATGGSLVGNVSRCQ